MYNQEMLERIVAKFGTDRAIEFCEVASMLYDIKFNACKEEDVDYDSLKAEYDYERDWWLEAGITLKQQQPCLTKSS